MSLTFVYLDSKDDSETVLHCSFLRIFSVFYGAGTFFIFGAIELEQSNRDNPSMSIKF